MQSKSIRCYLTEARGGTFHKLMSDSLYSFFKENRGGIILTLLLAGVSILLGSFTHFIGSSVIALLLGMLIKSTIGVQNHYNSGLNFVSKKLLRIGIILLGAGLSFSQLMSVGRYSLFVMTFTLVAAFGTGYTFGKLFGINWKLSSLISAGTGICGGSAIAALSPIIESDDSDFAYAISATFIFDVVMILLFPVLGSMMGLSDMAFGLWTGTAINDTSSVVAAGYAYSDAAGDFATIVKLTRTTAIVPVAIIFSFISAYLSKKQSGGSKKVSVKKLFPWFILWFALASVINSLGFIPHSFHDPLKEISKFTMVMALGAIGLKTDLRGMLRSGTAPMVLGFIVSTVVVVVSLAVQYMMGQI